MNNVTVIIPTYKRTTPVLQRAIESVLKQTFSNIEILVVDDNASKELSEFRVNNEKLISELNDSRICLIKNEKNLGSAKSRNKGIHLARGEYISFLDDDDMYLPGKIELQLQHLIKEKADFCFTNLIVLNENLKLVDYRNWNWVRSFDNNHLLKTHLVYKITQTNIFLFKREALIKVNGFTKEGMGDEFFLLADIIQNGFKGTYIDLDETILFRCGQDSMSVQSNRLEQEKEVFAYIKSHFSKLNFSERQYVRFRYEVMKIVTYKRCKKYHRVILLALKSLIFHPYLFFASPIKLIHGICKKQRYIELIKTNYL